METNIKALKEVVEKTHGGEATFLESVHIVEKFDDKKVWEGIVNVFMLEGHPAAKKCYAWSHEIEGTKKRRFFAVLHHPPISSPQDAVRAAIVQEYRTK